MRIVELVSGEEHNVGAAGLTTVDTVPNLPSANKISNKPVARVSLNPRRFDTPLRSTDIPGTFRRLHEMLPASTASDQMQKPPELNQMTLNATMKPTGEIDNAAAAVPPKAVMELFDVKAPVRQMNQSTYHFQVEGKPFGVEFAPASPGSVEVVLSRQGMGAGENPFNTLHDMGSKSVVVYSTFIAICAKYMKVYQPEVLFWYGFNEDQQRLYDKLAGYLARQAPDYVVQKNGVTIGFVRRDLVKEDFGPTSDEMNRIAQDKLSRRKPDMRKKVAVAMPGNTSTYPYL